MPTAESWLRKTLPFWRMEVMARHELAFPEPVGALCPRKHRKTPAKRALAFHRRPGRPASAQSGRGSARLAPIIGRDRFSGTIVCLREGRPRKRFGPLM